MKSLSPYRQRGISLLESLIAMLVTALGILGILGMQMRTLTDSQASVRRTQAIRLIEDLGERMTAHPNALGSMGSYVIGWTSGVTPASAVNCGSTNCTGAQLAAYDIAEWKRTVQRTMPQGDANVFIAPADAGSVNNQRQLGVMISWRENERDTTANYRDRIDATKVTGSGGSLYDGAGSAATCPSGRICHLQYLAVPARCAPYTLAGSTQYFCPGA
ncbi:MAG: type IV pilus modification protein PilV [Pseudomonadota bacterium]|nr:type IV pilus modification protein PilV [Pseudomonadota bacterium]